MEAKHTPAPWRASEGAEGIIVNYVTDEDRPGSGVATICQVIDHDGSAVPDANLIAAAPDLLAALKGLMPILAAVGIHTQFGKSQLERISKAQTAISKAEGKR